MRNIRLVAPLVLVAALAACSSSPTDSLPDDMELPAWYLSPPIENQFVGTNCQEFTGHLDIDKEASAAASRVALATQLNSAVRVLTENRIARTNTGNGVSVGSNFEQNAEQKAEASLRGAILSKVEMGKVDGKRQICTLVVLNPQQTKALFKDIMADAGETLDQRDEDVLYQQFLAAQGQAKLQNAFSK